MNIRTLLSNFFHPKPAKPPRVSEKGVQARAICHLIAHGKIDALTVQNMGTTDARKMFTIMRRLGLLFEADNIRGHDLKPNSSGRGQHRVHKWTGKVPANWPDAKKR